VTVIHCSVSFDITSSVTLVVLPELEPPEIHMNMLFSHLAFSVRLTAPFTIHFTQSFKFSFIASVFPRISFTCLIFSFTCSVSQFFANDQLEKSSSSVTSSQNQLGGINA
jgi:hypothetical protein